MNEFNKFNMQLLPASCSQEKGSKRLLMNPLPGKCKLISLAHMWEKHFLTKAHTD